MLHSRKHLWRIVGISIAALSLLSIALQLRASWSQLAGIRIAPAPALLALVCGSLSLVAFAALWHSTLWRLGGRLSLATAMRIWFSSQLVRYVPGNIWHLMGRVYLTQQAGVGTRVTSMSLVVELMQTITAALLMAAASLLFWQRQSAQSLWTLLLIPLLLCYTLPQLLLQRPLEWALRRTGLGFPDISLHRRDLFALLPGYCGSWIAYGCGLYLLALSIHPLPLRAIPALVGIFAIAWVVGFLSFITPSGLGVREGVLGYLLSSLMPLPVALLLALLARVWLTVAELGCAALVVWRLR
jgi:glycosyltransferase 2 family protein